MHLPGVDRQHRTAARGLASSLVGCLAVVLCLTACRGATAQGAPPGQSVASGSDAARSNDAVDKALDRIDAARSRLEAADAAAAKAARDLDGALDDAARLNPGARSDDMSYSAAELERESKRMSERWQNVGRRWDGYGERWADLGQRIAARAERLARVQARVAEREAERNVGHSLDDEDWSDGGRHGDMHHSHDRRHSDADDDDD